jgi:hypothetical protein
VIRKLRLFLVGCPVCGRWRTRHFAFCALRERY